MLLQYNKKESVLPEPLGPKTAWALRKPVRREKPGRKRDVFTQKRKYTIIKLSSMLQNAEQNRTCGFAGRKAEKTIPN